MQLSPQNQQVLRNIQTQVKLLLNIPNRTEQQQKLLQQLGEVQQKIIRQGQMQALRAQQQKAALAGGISTASTLSTATIGAQSPALASSSAAALPSTSPGANSIQLSANMSPAAVMAGQKVQSTAAAGVKVLTPAQSGVIPLHNAKSPQPAPLTAVTPTQNTGELNVLPCVVSC